MGIDISTRNRLKVRQGFHRVGMPVFRRLERTPCHVCSLICGIAVYDMWRALRRGTNQYLQSLARILYSFFWWDGSAVLIPLARLEPSVKGLTIYSMSWL